MSIKLLKFGGKNLRQPSWTWYYTASTVQDVQLHCHVGDYALIVDRDEAERLRALLWRGVPADTSLWSKDHFTQYERAVGAKMIYSDSPRGKAHNALAYVSRGQAKVVSKKMSPEEFLGIATENEKGDLNGDD